MTEGLDELRLIFGKDDITAQDDVYWLPRPIMPEGQALDEAQYRQHFAEKLGLRESMLLPAKEGFILGVKAEDANREETVAKLRQCNIDNFNPGFYSEEYGTDLEDPNTIDLTKMMLAKVYKRNIELHNVGDSGKQMYLIPLDAFPTFGANLSRGAQASQLAMAMRSVLQSYMYSTRNIYPAYENPENAGHETPIGIYIEKGTADFACNSGTLERVGTPKELVDMVLRTRSAHRG